MIPKKRKQNNVQHTTLHNKSSLWTDIIVSSCTWCKPLILWLRLRRAIMIVRTIEKIDAGAIREHLLVLEQNKNVDLVISRLFVIRFTITNAIAIATFKTELMSRKLK